VAELTGSSNAAAKLGKRRMKHLTLERRKLGSVGKCRGKFVAVLSSLPNSYIVEESSLNSILPLIKQIKEF